jgi:tRNA/tmRNA/rRNA uracil-C5-methylase (TrmA/RlmC/RlmD family)
MYCGCGAHTVALGRTGLLETIEAVELDQRLVDACLVNVKQNELQDVVRVTQRDAGEWAKRFQKKQQTETYDILLVDPPRMGLDEQVCHMTCQGDFEHFLYISCGHKALLRDLERLSSDFEVVNCVQMDLFPRTDSIETLVHLTRIRKDAILT